VRDYIHVEDLADAHLRALAYLQAGHGNFECNLGTGHGFTVREIIDTASRVTGRPIPYEVAPRREGDPAELVSGGTRARTVLGWRPERGAIEDVIGDAWRFMQGHPAGYRGG
jgi:UDP-glucose 4-epimerase